LEETGKIIPPEEKGRGMHSNSKTGAQKTSRPNQKEGAAVYLEYLNERDDYYSALKTFVVEGFPGKKVGKLPGRGGGKLARIPR